MNKWKGSGLNYSNINFSRKFRPSHKANANVALAYWDMYDKDLTIFLPSFKACFGNRNSWPLYRKFINTLSHECIHGVIQMILEKDRFTGEFESHWPHLHGMDDDYKRMLERLHLHQ